MERTGNTAKGACKKQSGAAEKSGGLGFGRHVPTSISSMADIRPAAEALRDIARELGSFRVAACDNIASKIQMHDADSAILASDVFGWPTSDEQWWKKPLLALSSPLPIACRYESEPFWANAEGIYTRTEESMIQSINLSHYKDTVKVTSAIVVPVHMPFGQIGAVSFSPLEDERTDLSAEFEQYADNLEYHARRFIIGYSRVTCHRPWIPHDCRLSKREVECLRWAAVGKTDKEVAMIINRSCATVRFHIHNAAVKLDSVNRSQTVFKASQLGFLGSVAVTETQPVQASQSG